MDRRLPLPQRAVQVVVVAAGPDQDRSTHDHLCETDEGEHDVERLGRRARELGFLVQVNTNGVKLPGGFERIQTIDRYILPLEATRAEVHDN